MSKLFFVLVLAIAVDSHAQTPQDLVQDAQQKQRAGDLDGAAAEYRQFLKLHPEATAIHSNLGAALAGLGRFEEAISEYKIALKQSPDLVAARLNLALCYYKMGRIEDTASELQRVRTASPDNLQAVLLLGDCYMRLGRESDVIRVLEPEEQKHPGDLTLTLVYYRLKRPDDSKRECEIVQRLTPAPARMAPSTSGSSAIWRRPNWAGAGVVKNFAAKALGSWLKRPIDALRQCSSNSGEG